MSCGMVSATLAKIDVSMGLKCNCSSVTRRNTAQAESCSTRQLVMCSCCSLSQASSPTQQTKVQQRSQDDTSASMESGVHVVDAYAHTFQDLAMLEVAITCTKAQPAWISTHLNVHTVRPSIMSSRTIACMLDISASCNDCRLVQTNKPSIYT